MNKYFLAIALITSITYSNTLKDIATSYIEYGQKKAIQDIEILVRQKSFWKNYISDIDTTYGYFGYKDYLILSSKKDKKIDIFKIKNKNPILHKTIDALFGSIDGDKQIEGDKKTPIGLYDFIARLDRGKSRLARKYGPLALVTTYPNLMDKLMHKKTGHGIWLHGKPYNKQNKADTLGCVAIDNDQLSKLGKLINYKKTIFAISKNEYTTATKDEIAIVLANLYTWKFHWQNNNFKQYISYYASNFRRYDNRNLKKFSYFKKNIFKKGRKKNITFTQINVIPYTQGDGEKIFKISFYEKYTSKTYNFKGQKNIYAKLTGEKISILVEE